MPASPYDAIGGSSVGSRPASNQKNGPQYFAAFAATIGSLIMGTTISWSSPAAPLLQLSPEEDGFNLTKDQVSWVGCLMPTGALIGGQIGGFLMSKLGRKGGMMVCATMASFSLLLLAAANNVAMIYAGRICSGICTGITSVICPTYVAEISTADKRGFLGGCVQVMVTIGIVEVISVGICGSWRWLTISCLFLTVLWIGCIFFIPESPVHYITLKRYSDARESLEWLRGTNDVEIEYEEIVRGVEESSRNSTAGFRELFKKENLLPFMIAMTLMLGQQFSGMNAVMFYANSIFEEANTGLSSSVENIIISIVQVVATMAGAVFMDKLGRRILLNMSSVFMGVSLGVLGWYFYIAEYNKDLAAKIDILPVASLSIFVAFFSIGFGPIPWLMMSELFSPDIKSMASSITTSFNWTLAFVVTKFFTNLVDALKEFGAFWFFAAGLAFIFIFCVLFVPETKGKSLDEVQQIFRSDQPYFLSIGIWKCCRGQGSEDTRPIIQDDILQSR